MASFLSVWLHPLKMLNFLDLSLVNPHWLYKITSHIFLSLPLSLSSICLPDMAAHPSTYPLIYLCL